MLIPYKKKGGGGSWVAIQNSITWKLFVIINNEELGSFSISANQVMTGSSGPEILQGERGGATAQGLTVTEPGH